MLKKLFYKWIEFTLLKFNRRQQLLDASLFRYRQLLRKSLKAVQWRKEQRILKQYFKLWKSVHIEIKMIVHDFHKVLMLKRKRQYFIGFCEQLQKQRGERLIKLEVTDVYRQKLLLSTFKKLKRIVRKQKKHRVNISIIQKSRKALFFDKWVLSYQNSRFHKQLIQDSNRLYKDNILKKCFQRWLKFLREAKQEKQNIQVKRILFRAWRTLAIDTRDLNEERFKDIHSKYLLALVFKKWKDNVIVKQKVGLARQFNLYKIFNAWKQYIQEEKQIEEDLTHNELVLTINNMKALKQYYFHQWKQAYDSRVEKVGLIDMMLDVRRKQQKIQLLKTAFKSLKYNWMLKHYLEIQLIKKIMKVFVILKSLVNVKKQLTQKLVKFKDNRIKRKLAKSFMSLQSNRSAYIKKKELADVFYQKKLSKFIFQIFVGAIVHEFEQSQILAKQFYRKRRVILCFNVIRDNVITRQRKRQVRQMLKQYNGYRRFYRLKRIFSALRLILSLEILKTKRRRQILWTIFYEWRLSVKLRRMKQQSYLY